SARARPTGGEHRTDQNQHEPGHDRKRERFTEERNPERDRDRRVDVRDDGRAYRADLVDQGEEDQERDSGAHDREYEDRREYRGRRPPARQLCQADRQVQHGGYREGNRDHAEPGQAGQAAGEDERPERVPDHHGGHLGEGDRVSAADVTADQRRDATEP